MRRHPAGALVLRATRIALAGSLGCSAGVSLPKPGSPAALIIGSWDLDEGCGGIAYHCSAPAALSEPSRYTFSTTGVVTAFRGDAELFRAGYTIADSSADRGQEKRVTLTIGGGPLVDPRPLLVRFATSDTMYLDEGCCDRFTFRYHRVR